MHQRYWEHIRYHWLLLAWLLPGYKVTKVTWVTRVTRVTRLRRLRCLYKSSKLIQGSKVSEVTGVTEGFCWWFSLTSPELQGYEGYGPFFKFSKDQIKVTRFQKLRGLRKASANDFPWHPQSYKVSKVTVLFFQIFKRSDQGYKVS